MNLGPTELARLLVFQVAELARRNLAQGLRLNAPEAIAIASDEMHLAARAGGTLDDVVEAGRSAVSAEDLMAGVADLIAEIRVEVLLREGSRLVVLRDLGRSNPVGDAPSDGAPEPGAIRVGAGALILNAGLVSKELEVRNSSDHPVRISSHFPFDRVQARLVFDRAAAAGTRLDIPAGDTVRWAPGESRVVRLVAIAPGRTAAPTTETEA